MSEIDEREVRIDEAVRAAKAACLMCSNGADLWLSPSGLFRHRVNGYNNRRQIYDCRAHGIHKRIMELRS